MPEEFSQIDIVIPVYNEGAVIRDFYQMLVAVINELPQRFTIYFVNDGSSDSTGAILDQIVDSDERVVVVELSRNYGHQTALTAGLGLSEGEIVITMDGDGQNPPEMIPEMLNLASSGYDIVLMQRIEEQRGVFKNLTSRGFYWLINRFSGIEIPPGAADFRLMSRRAVDAIKQMGEYHRFLRGMVAWVGFPSIILPYHPHERLGGKTKYSLKKMVQLALDAFFSFSLRPLYLMILVGGVFLFFSFAEIIYVLNFWVRGLGDTLAPGWSSLMFVVLFVGGTTMISLGIVGIYIGDIFQEVKKRPLFFIKGIKRKK